jgi:superfamily II DNA helicase RecQ
MEIEKLKVILDDVASGKIAIIFSTTTVSLGLNMPEIAAVIVHGNPYTIVNVNQVFGRARRKGSIKDVIDTARCLFLTNNSIIDSDAKQVTSDEDEEERYNLEVRDRGLLSKFMFDATCKANIYDTSLPPFEVDGKLIDRNISECGRCVSCVLGIESIDMTRDGVALLQACDRVEGQVCGHSLACIVTGQSDNSTLGKTYKEENLLGPSYPHDMVMFKKLSCATYSQVVILIQKMMIAGYFNNVDILVSSTIRKRRACVQISSKGRSILSNVASKIMIDVIKSPEENAVVSTIDETSSDKDLKFPTVFSYSKNGLPISPQIPLDHHLIDERRKSFYDRVHSNTVIPESNEGTLDELDTQRLAYSNDWRKEIDKVMRFIPLC